MPPSPSHCPACDSAGLTPFYRLDRIPIQSNLLLRTREEALAMPTGDLRMAHCPACGFISNLAFDLASQELSAQYEASQGFSGTFNAFAKSLAKSWAERYALKGKTAIEIGCGKGEFLATLCREAGCRGVGYDPTLDPRRLPDTAGLDIEFLPDTFDARATSRDFDFVCCRHTLEHIPDVGAFARMLRQVIGNRSKVRVAFEVPDTLRVLKEGAFWDAYYEHCSYFTIGSLARLFARERFEVLDVRRVFDDQYLILEAAPADKPTTPPAHTNDLAEIADAVAAFGQMVSRAADQWRHLFEPAGKARKRVVLWGASSKAVGFLSTLGLNYEQAPAVVDINPHKQGTFLPTSGSAIVSPDWLIEYQPEIVLMMNPIYRNEIGQDLEKRGVRAELLAV